MYAQEIEADPYAVTQFLPCQLGELYTEWSTDKEFHDESARQDVISCGSSLCMFERYPAVLDEVKVTDN